MEFRKLPIYKIVINPDDEETGMSAISLVDFPAIETSFELFGKQEPLKLSIQNEEKHLVTGPALINGMPIYRRSMDLGEYFVVFEEDTINAIIEKYSKEGLWNNVSLQHDGHNVDGIVAVEFYKKDSTRGIVPKGYEDVSDGSLFVTFKVNDNELWDYIKTSGEFSGFSIEILADLEPTTEFADDGYDYDISEDEQDLFDLLKEIFGDDIDILFADEKKKQFKADWKSIDDAIDNNREVEFNIDGDKTVKGYPYTIYTREGSKNVAVYDGKKWHILNDNNIKSTKLTGNSGGIDWAKAIKAPDFDYVQKSIDEAADVKNIASVPKNDYERAVLEHRIAMITYVDEVGKETGICVGNRQCGVFELGFTRAGNACMRVYEYAGPTHHTENPIPSWRNLLYSRIRSFRIVDWLEPLTNAPAGFNETGPDRDQFQCTLRSDLKVG